MEIQGTEYILVPQGLLGQRNMTEGKALLCGLIHGLSGKFGYCSAKNDYLAEYFNIKESAMKKRILRLIEDDFILNIGTKKERKLVLKMFKEKGQIVTKEGQKGQIVTQKGQIVTNVDLLLTLYSNNKYIIKVKSSDFDPSKVTSESQIRILLFEYFWYMFPNKVKRKLSLEKFMKLKVEKLEVLINVMHLVHAYYSQESDESLFIPACPHPTTFIIQERWTDEQYLTAQKSPKKGGDFLELEKTASSNPSLLSLIEKLRDLSNGDEAIFNQEEAHTLKKLGWTAEEALEEYYCYQNVNVMMEVIAKRLNKGKVA